MDEKRLHYWTNLNQEPLENGRGRRWAFPGLITGSGVSGTCVQPLPRSEEATPQRTKNRTNTDQTKHAPPFSTAERAATRKYKLKSNEPGGSKERESN